MKHAHAIWLWNSTTQGDGDGLTALGGAAAACGVEPSLTIEKPGNGAPNSYENRCAARTFLQDWADAIFPEATEGYRCLNGSPETAETVARET